MKNKAIKMRIGLFYGKEIFVEREFGDNFDYAKAFENYIGMEKRDAVERYKELKYQTNL